MTTQNNISEEIKKEIEEIYQHFPQKSAACIEGLKVIQKHHRWVSDEAVKELAQILEMSPDAIDSVATFYSLIFRKPVGRHVILVCDSVSCWMMDYEKIAGYLKNKLSIDFGETTKDDRFTLLTIPCLGTCDRAPAMMVDEDLHRDLTTDKIDEILKNYE
ncbi:NADH-quinone oxidoreductase subunit NuoE [Sunxiuqinia dokdonensis]|uniref:NADH dehydrogenase subunit E n=1 Tax=Sunxiuqinia dokdonensis TaxID=1409788 RepID=A0A0L8V6A6_9BACT|nr:NADH-quinone oxidoreductase subunit NuoE [Sunxiuqinia dokdonensis]KOH43712.1 NADH dehydrogenase subunit E [Sunxiuqinia dokdonensis]|tara:strand:+ start:49967 stop:50446 length:480 start_codon:yes stop_codon:yes gene_type:complete